MGKIQNFAGRICAFAMAAVMLMTSITFPKASQLSGDIPFEYGSGALTSLSAQTKGYGYGFQYSPERNATRLFNAYLIENQAKDSQKYIEFKNAGWHIGSDKKNHKVDMRLYLWDYQESEASADDRSHSFVWIDQNQRVRISSCSADGTYKGETAEHYHQLANSTNGGVHMEYRFYDSASGAEIPFTGVITYKDIDGQQGQGGNIVNEGISIAGGDVQVLLTNSTVIEKVERNGMEWYQGSMYTEDINGADGHTQDDQKITLKFKSTADNPLHVIYRNNTVNGRLVSDYQHMIDNETVTITYQIPDAGLPKHSSNATAKALIEQGGGEQKRYLNYASDTASEDAQEVLNIPAEAVNGYTFDGWYESDTFAEATKWSGVSSMTGSVTLYGRYVPKQYNLSVKLKIDGNSALKDLETKTFSYGDKIEYRTPYLESKTEGRTYELQYALVNGVRKDKSELHPAGSSNLNRFFDKIDKDVEIIYVYKLVDATGSVSVEHLIEGTNEHLEGGRYDETYEGPIGQSAYVAPVDVEGWKVVAYEADGHQSTTDLTSKRQQYVAGGVTVKFYYRAVSGGLTIRYVYDGEPEVQVSTSTNVNGEIGEEIDADAKRREKESSDQNSSFEGLEFLGVKSGNDIVQTSDSRYQELTRVSLTGQAKVVTFVYKVKETGIIVRHISKDSCDGGNKILEAEPIVYKNIGEVFAAQSKAFKGYDLIGDSGNTVYRATAADNGQTVYIDYYYQHEKHKLTVRYRDDKGNQFVYRTPGSADTEYQDVVTSNIHYGQTWTALKKDAWGYSVEPGEERTGTMDTSDVEVTYVYAPKPATVIVRHITESGMDIVPQKEHHEWKFNDEYSVTADEGLTEAEKNTLSEYSHITEERQSGRINTFDGEGVITVDFIYTKAPARVVIQHVCYDEDGNKELLAMETLTGNSGDAWTSAPWAGADDAGYVLLHTPEPSSGTMKAGTTTVEYTYQKKKGTLEVQYLTRDGNGNLVQFGLSSYTTDVTYGQNVQTVPKTYPEYNHAYGYTVDSVQGQNTSGWQIVRSGGKVVGYNGTITANRTVVQYIYNVDKVTVTTKYRQQTGAEIEGPDAGRAEDWVQQYDAFSRYETHNDTTKLPPSFYGYEWTGRHPWNSYGTLGADDVTVTYTYLRKDAELRVNYVDEAGNALAPSKTREGLVFEDYDESPVAITGYEFKELKAGSSPAKGTLTEEGIVITFVYERAASSVVVRYVDMDGNTLSPADTINGSYGNAFNASPKDISGWTLASVQATGNVEVDEQTKTVSGHFSVQTQTVKFIYTKTGTKAVVNYIDEETGNSIHNPITITGSVGDPYEAEIIELFGYSYKGPASFSAPESGTLGEGVTIVTLMYGRNDASVTVHFVDNATGNPITEDKRGQKVQNPLVINGKFKDPYETEAASIYGWRLVRTPDNASGSMIDGNIDVTYRYAEHLPSVTTEYVDIDDGHEVSEKEVITGQTGDRYETIAKDYDAEPEKYPELYGYELAETPENASGIIGEEDITVTYKYQKKTRTITVLYVDESGNEVSPADTMADLTVGDWYNTTAKTVFGYELIDVPDNAKGYVTEKPITVTYVYRRVEARVKVRYVNQSMQDIAESVTIVGQMGDSYETTAKEIEGYRLVSIPANWSGTMTAKETAVTYIYKVATATVTTRYINADEEDEIKRFLADNVVATYPWGAEYTTEAKEFEGMILLETPENAMGIADNPDGEVVDYYYSQKEASVIAKYVDMETGRQIAPQVVQTGSAGSEYATIRKDIDGYELDHVEGETTGTMKAGITEVTYFYRALEATVIARYVDENGSSIADEEVISGKVGDEYETVQKEIPGYGFKSVTANARGTMTEDVIYVVYTYQAMPVSITVRHLDEQGENAANPEHMSCKRGDSYQTSAKEIYGYELVETPENASGVADTDEIEVIYVYRTKDTKVIARYIDDKTEEDVAVAETLEGRVFDEYQTEAKEVEGYSLKEIPENAEGVMMEETITVTYRYEKEADEEEPAKVIIRYVDEDGVEVEEPTELEGKPGDPYDAQPKEIPGYELVEMPENAKGEMSEEPIEVVFQYKKTEEEKADGKVTVKYVDADGNEIAEMVEISGKEGDEYTTSAKEIEGYELEETPANASGTITKEGVEVIYRYKKAEAKVIIKFVDENGEEIAPPKEITGSVGDEYEVKPDEIEGWEPGEIPDNAKGEMTKDPIEVIFTYKPAEQEADTVIVTVKYVDENGKAIAPSTTITGKEGDDYKATPKDISGYELKETPSNASGKFAAGVIVTFVYKAKQATGPADAKVIVRHINQNGKEIATSVTIHGKVGDSYEAKSKTITGYKLKDTPKNAKGKMTAKDITVTFTYQKEGTEKSAVSVTKVATDASGKEVKSIRVGNTLKYAITVSAIGADAKDVVVKDKFDKVSVSKTTTVAASSGSYILDMGNKVFHTESCKNLDSISTSSKRKTTRSYSILTKLGYKPAEDCQPKEAASSSISAVSATLKADQKSVKVVDADGKTVKADVSFSDSGEMTVNIDKIKAKGKVTISYTAAVDNEQLVGKKITNNVFVTSDAATKQSAKSVVQISAKDSGSGNGSGTGTGGNTTVKGGSASGQSSDSGKVTGVRTGDAYGIIFVMLAAGMLAAGLAVLFLKKKKN